MRAACWIGLAALTALLGAALAEDAPASCSCASARVGNGGWCDAHERGYVAGIEMTSTTLFEALDAHGHEVVAEALVCGVCREAHATDGFCEQHRIGFVGSQAYFSRLSYHLAQGRVRDPAEIACPVCRRHAESLGWCEEHGLGRVAHVEIDDRESFERLSKAYRDLLAATETAHRCELCAAAMIVGGRCPACKITYADGKPVD